ncbi:DUF4132 domain-containing protein [Dactylosporangium sp. NPDC050588]|uniref:DUF4132 domain-containing protein n=1 Tax=Dactylosporangium sp. NPDC050588 TaxID=3157211 RepID=UPI0033F3CE62
MAAGRVVVEGLVCKEPAGMAWEDGERDLWWSRAAALEHGLERPDWGAVAAGADRVSDLTPPQVVWLFAKGPEVPARALLGKLVTLRHRQRVDLCRVLVARFELDALPFVRGEAKEHADELGVLLLPFRAPEVATLVAGWLRHLGSARLWARLWLGRHAGTAARALIPAAAGRSARERQHAEEGLRFLASIGHGPTIAEAAAEYGPDVADLVAAGLEQPAPRAARRGKRPGWTLPERLPEISLAGGGTMPLDEVARLVDGLTRARLADPPEPPPGDPAPRRDRPTSGVESSKARQPLVHLPDPQTRALIDDCDRGSLAEFGRALLTAWVADGMPPAEAWVVPAQAHVGDDSTMDMLAPLRRSWSQGGRWERSVEGLAVLATAGTDVSLRHLLAVEERLSAGPTNDRTGDYLAQAAERRGMTVTQLADRLAPAHGLDTGVTLDYGPRAFTVGVDGQLTAFVADADGRRLARPPKPGVKDTNPAAYQQFLRLKKDLRSAAAAQVARLERDMLARRFRPARDLPAVVLPHPVLGPVARRLLWGEYGPRDHLVRALRIAEDGSFTDRHDATVTVGGDAWLGVVHPADLGGDLAGWVQVFTDYEILQPFPQLYRPAMALTEAQRDMTGLTGFGPVPADRIAHLLGSARWQGNGYHRQQRLHTQLAHRLPGGLTMLVELDPGVETSAVTAVREQRVTEIWADDSWSDHWQVARRIPMGRCDAAALSEVLAELYAVT